MKNQITLSITFILLLTLTSFAQTKMQNVILITLDGARNQEIFGGLDSELVKQIDKEAEKSRVFQMYNLPTEKQRREKLMPFFWNTWMTKFGSIAGNRNLKSEVKTTNNLLFSYPGYSEILTGEAHDEVIKSNDRIQNSFPSVLDFVQTKLGLGENKVASFASWNVMNEIATSKPNAFIINAGFEAYESKDSTTRKLSTSQFETQTPWDSVRHDFYTFRFAMDFLKTNHPRFIHIGLGETDDWAHDKRYDRMVEALNRTDNYFRELWEFIQSDAQYKDKTSILITVDHGRGSTALDWYSHGKDVPEARWIWMAFISPASKLRGEWKNSETIYQNQAAATLTKFIGLNYSQQNQNAGKPIEKLFTH